MGSAAGSHRSDRLQLWIHSLSQTSFRSMDVTKGRSVPEKRREEVNWTF